MIFLRPAIEIAVKNVFSSVSQCLEKMGEYSFIQTKNGNLIYTRLQTIFNLKFESPLENKIWEQILTHCLQAEKKGTFAFEATLKKIIGLEVENPIPETLMPDRTVFEELSQKVFGNSFLNSLMKDSFDLVGFNGKILIEKTDNSMISVEKISGYLFDLFPLFKPQEFLVENSKFFCVDGFIENPNEIQQILSDCNQSKQSLFLFARGFSDETIHTLKVNYNRKTLQVFPVLTRYDLEGVNLLNDLAIISGNDLVSSLKGEMISKITLEQLKFVELVKFQNGKILIRNKSTSQAVHGQITHLKNKLEQVDALVVPFIQKRIKNLNSNQVVVRLPDDPMYVVYSQQIDYLLRAWSEILEKGYFLNSRNELVLSTTELYSSQFAQLCLSQINNLSAVILD